RRRAAADTDPDGGRARRHRHGRCHRSAPSPCESRRSAARRGYARGSAQLSRLRDAAAQRAQRGRRRVRRDAGTVLRGVPMNARAWPGRVAARMHTPRVTEWAPAAGVGVLAAVWFGPLPGLASELFAAHMAMHIAVVCVAAPLIAVGLGGSRFDPVESWPVVFSPLTASLIELVVVWGWHAPGPHEAAR